MRADKAIHELYDHLPEITKTLFTQGVMGRYGTYYAENRLYFVYDHWTQSIFFTKADSPKEAIKRVENRDLVYTTDQEEDENE